MIKKITLKASLLIGIALIIALGCSKSYKDILNDTDSTIEKSYMSECKIIVTFESNPENYNVTIPPLKYNKDFCLGFHLDDGAQDIYSYAFQLLNGGKIGTANYDGLKYTDGCGNDIAFKMSTSIYSMTNDQNTDLHNPNSTNNYYINWPEIVELYKHGWGVYNHGYTAVSDTDPVLSVRMNHNYVKSKTLDAKEGGICMKILAIPDGIESYSEPAFQQNYRLAFTESYLFGNPYFDITIPWTKSNITLGRSLLKNINLKQLVDEMAIKSINGVHNWGSVFSHSLIDPTYGYGFDNFKNLMVYIANRYGKYGLDNIWMVSEEETLDYSILREQIRFNKVLSQDKLEITIAGNIPRDLRFVGTSLIVNSNVNIISISVDGAGKSSYNGLGTKTSLINLDFTDI